MSNWTCRNCEYRNPSSVTECSRCHSTWNEAVCEMCGRKTILPLITIVPERGTNARWGIRSTALKHIPKEFRGGLRLGMKVCFRCQAPDMVFTEYSEEGRRCAKCNGPVRSSNTDPLCERCKGRTRLCPGCGVKLSAAEYDYCYKCERGMKARWPEGITYLAPYRERKILDTNRPMKPGPGGIISRNRAGISIIGVKEEITLRLNRTKENIKKIDSRLRRLVEAYRRKNRQANIAKSRGLSVEAEVLRSEAERLNDLVEKEKERIRREKHFLSELQMVLRNIEENHTWRASIPKTHRPNSKDRGYAWSPLLFSEDRDDTPAKSDVQVVQGGRNISHICEVCNKEYKNEKLQFFNKMLTCFECREIRLPGAYRAREIKEEQ